MAQQEMILISKQDLLNVIRTALQEELSKLVIPQPLQPEKLITRKQAAAELRITLPTLDIYTNEGRIPVYRIGSQKRYKLNEVIAACIAAPKYSRNS